MAGIEINGRLYKELPDGKLQDIGPATGGGTYIPPSPTTQRTKEAGADKAEIDVATGSASLPYVAPAAAANLENAQLTNQQLQEKLLRERMEREEMERAQGRAVTAREAAVTELESAVLAAQKAKELSQKGWFATGFGAKLASGLGGSDAANVKGLLDTISGNTAFDRLQRMRDASPTGGALGGVSAPELDMLKSTVASLGQDQSDEKFQESMDRVIEVYGAQLNKIAPEKAAKLGIATSDGGAVGGGGVAPTGFGSGAGVTSKGGFQAVPELKGTSQEVINLIASGADTDGVMRYLEQRYAGVKPDGLGGLRAPEELRPFIADIVNRHRQNPREPVAGLAEGWQKLEGYEQPEADGGFLGSVGDGTSFLGGVGQDAAAGVMSAGNAFIGGNMANLAGNGAGDVIGAMRQNSPLSSFAGDMTGSALAMSTLGGAANRLGVTGLTRAGGIGGDALYGGTRGFSETEGDLGDKAIGGAFGLLAAGGGNAVGQYGLAPALRGLGQTRVGGAAADLVANTPTAVRNAYRGVRGEAATPYQGAGIPESLSPARQIIGRNLPEDTDPIARLLAEGRDLNMPLSLADTTPQLRSLGGAAFRNSGQEARDAVTGFQQGRMLGQGDRAVEQIESAFGPIGNPNRAVDDLTAQARENAGPLYDAAYARSGAGAVYPQIEGFLGRPSMQGALGNATRIAREEGIDPTSLGFTLNQAGEVELTRVPSWQTLDYVKRGLDDVVEGYRDPTTRQLNLDTEGRAINNTLRDFLGVVDNANPEYAAARAAYAAPARAKDALQQGRGFMGQQPRDIQDQMGRMAPENQEFYRSGARVAMGDKVAATRDVSNPYNAIVGAPAQRERLTSIFPEGTDRFGRAYGMENRMAETGREFLGGSQTASRLAADSQLGNGIGSQIIDGVTDTAITGAPVRAGVGMIARLLGNRAKTGLEGQGEEVASEIAQALGLQAQPDEIAQILAEIAANRNYVNSVRGASGRGVASLAAPALSYGGAYE